MRIALGNDHAGYPLKAHVRVRARSASATKSSTRGAQDEAPVDFPDITWDTCKLVLPGRGRQCRAGLRHRVKAPSWRRTRFPGIRCALAHDVYSAHQSVEHDDANAIAMGAWVIGQSNCGGGHRVLPRRTFRRRRGHRPAGPQAATSSSATRLGNWPTKSIKGDNTNEHRHRTIAGARPNTARRARSRPHWARPPAPASRTTTSSPTARLPPSTSAMSSSPTRTPSSAPCCRSPPSAVGFLMRPIGGSVGGYLARPVRPQARAGRGAAGHGHRDGR